MMMKRVVFVCAICLLGLGLEARSALAQYGPRPMGSGAAVGEKYAVEFALNFWTPDRDIQISSESLGIVGTTIDAVTDLGFEKETFRDWRLVVRPSRKFKLRLGVTPIRYQAESVLTRDIVFNGQRYSVGLPVNSDFDWKAWRFGIEYDFVYGNRGFVGFVTDIKYTDVKVSLVNPLANEFTSVKVPIPTVGGVARVYLARNLALNGEISGLKLSYDDNEGTYVDFDINGTLNFTNNVGAQFGYRSLNVDYIVDEDSGNLDLNGVYFGGVVRF
jgi:hypothetical protein